MTNAYVTLLTNESYLPGAILLAHALKEEFATKHKLVILLQESALSDESIALIKLVYDEIIPIDGQLLTAPNDKVVEQLGRSELSVTFSKLLLWKLVEYDLVVYLDADTLVLTDLDHLFEDHADTDEASIVAASDSGWPDVFNSGVFVAKPSSSTFEKLVELSSDPENSFDGADQGLLNEHFNIATKGKNWTRLPFLYNVTTNLGQHYEFLPAFTKFFKDIKLLHFIGSSKPWHLANGIVGADTANFHHLWWAAFNKYFASDPVTKSKILQLSSQGEAYKLNFEKYANTWDKDVPSSTTVEAPTEYQPVNVFPWESRENKPAATRVFDYVTDETDVHPARVNKVHSSISKDIETLDKLKISEPKAKSAYDFSEDQSSFNPDKSLEEVSKLPLKFLSKQQGKSNK